MPWERKLAFVICSFLLPLPLAFGDSTHTVLQLTVQPPRSPNHDDFSTATLLRELQRQALLISAREEFGIATRDMVLREPFAAPTPSSISTLLCATEIEKNKSAQLSISRFETATPTDPFALAELPVEKSIQPLQTVTIPLSNLSSINYLDFIAQCEQASRTTYLKALADLHLPGTTTPSPTQWAPTDLPADADALLHLQHLDVFSQYLAVRTLHAQMRSTGASPSRIDALVRAYSNLGQLTRNQWSQANKAFSARALLYAQRLVLHEHTSPASLYTRAYALAFVGLHAAALDDLSSAKNQPTQNQSAPDWVPLIEAWCDYDLPAIQACVADTPWPNAQLATFIAAKISFDGFATDRQQAIKSQATTAFPGLFVFDSLENSEASESENSPFAAGDQILSQLPTLLIHTLSNTDLPAKARAELHLVDPGDNTFHQLAALRNDLLTSPDTTEPSYAVLADLIEQQTFTGIVQRAITAGAAGPKIVQLLGTSAQRILKAHPWKPYVDALQLEYNSEGNQLDQTLAKVKDRDIGPWIAHTILDRYQTPGSSDRYIKNWIQSAAYNADPLVEDYLPPDPSSKISERTKKQSLNSMRATSPCSATILLAWMKTFPIANVVKNQKLYDNTLTTIEKQFSDRPSLLALASDWASARSDFSRALNLLLTLDSLQATPHTCDQLALVQNRLGLHAKAIQNLTRGANLSDDTNEKAALYQRAAYFLIQLHAYDSALTYVQASSEVPTVRVWQMSARCYEFMKRLDDADDALTQLSLLDNSTVAQHYLWARRLNRPNVETIHKDALAAITKPEGTFLPHFFVLLADNQDQQALSLLREHRDQLDDATQFAQLIILGSKLHVKQVVNSNINALHNRGGLHQDFGDAFKALIQNKNLTDAIHTFDTWADRQIDDEDAVDWFSLAGRYLLATNHPDQARVFLTRAIRTTVRERENYFLAWHALESMGENPTSLLNQPSTHPQNQ